MVQDVHVTCSSQVDLHPEIRLETYRLALCVSSDYFLSEGYFSHRCNKIGRGVGILLANQQIYHEAVYELYQKTTVKVQSKDIISLREDLTKDTGW
jgi:hypothetical protein